MKRLASAKKLQGGCVHVLMRAIVAMAGVALSACVSDARLDRSAPASSSSQVWDAAYEEQVYQERLKQLYTAGSDGFTPQENVVGARKVRPLPPARRDAISAEALAAARAYAAANNSRAFLVWRESGLEEESYFRGADSATPIISKSLAKPLTAIVIGRAIELGYVRSLDQPVSDFITEWRGSPKGIILIRHLLDMRSGLLAQGFADGDNIWNRAYLHPRHDEILLREYPMSGEPGVKFDYSNASAELIAIVIERATHMRYAHFISDQVLAPLGAAGGSVWIDRPGGLAHAGCCISLPAQSWMRLAVLLASDGRWNGKRLLPAGYVAAMRQPTPQNPYYGLGVYVPGAFTPRRGFTGPNGGPPFVLHGEPYLTQDFFLFDGNGDQVVYIVPNEKLVVMRLGDAPPRAPEWDNTVLLNTILRGLSPPAGGRMAQR